MGGGSHWYFLNTCIDPGHFLHGTVLADQKIQEGVVGKNKTKSKIGIMSNVRGGLKVTAALIRCVTVPLNNLII